jgi:cell division protein FtsB
MSYSAGRWLAPPAGFYFFKLTGATVWRSRPILFILTLFCCLLLAVLIGGDYNAFSIWGLYQQKEDLSRQVDSLRVENQLLADQIKLLDEDPRAIEKVAREQFGMARNEETIYRILPETADSSTHDSTASSDR